MELCNRGDLANYLFDKRRRQSPLTEQVVRSWLSQLSDALAYLHANKILHRDLKPHNVFLTSEGILKVGDFGLSATLENGKRTSHVGTPCYLAPEVMNHEAYGEAVDMWGAGCIGYEMVTLQFLWEKKGLLAASVKTQPLRAEDLPERFSPAIRECIVSCLQFTPGNRPRASALLSKVRASKRGGSDDASALAKALEGFVGSDALNGVVDSMRKQFESFSGLLFGGNSEPEIERPAALSVVRPIVPATEKTSDLLGHLDSDKDQGRDGPQGARGGGARGQGRSPGGSIGV